MLSWVALAVVAAGQFLAANADAHTTVRNLEYFGVSGYERSPYLGAHPSRGRVYLRLNLAIGGAVVAEGVLNWKIKHGEARAIWPVIAAGTIAVNCAGVSGNDKQYDGARASGMLREK
jgi:hypothetical protein